MASTSETWSTAQARVREELLRYAFLYDDPSSYQAGVEAGLGAVSAALGATPEALGAASPRRDPALTSDSVVGGHVG